MVAKFLDDNKSKTSLVNSHCFKLHRSYSVSFNLFKCRRNSLGLNPKPPYVSSEKENFCAVFINCIERVREISKLHVAFLQRLLRNVQKKGWFAVLVVVFCRPCLSSILLWCTNFCYHGNVTSHSPLNSAFLSRSCLSSRILLHSAVPLPRSWIVGKSMQRNQLSSLAHNCPLHVSWGRDNPTCSSLS